MGEVSVCVFLQAIGHSQFRDSSNLINNMGFGTYHADVRVYFPNKSNAQSVARYYIDSKGFRKKKDRNGLFSRYPRLVFESTVGLTNYNEVEIDKLLEAAMVEEWKGKYNIFTHACIQACEQVVDIICENCPKPYHVPDWVSRSQKYGAFVTWMTRGTTAGFSLDKLPTAKAFWLNLVSIVIVILQCVLAIVLLVAKKPNWQLTCTTVTITLFGMAFMTLAFIMESLSIRLDKIVTAIGVFKMLTDSVYIACGISLLLAVKAGMISKRTTVIIILISCILLAYYLIILGFTAFVYKAVLPIPDFLQTAETSYSPAATALEKLQHLQTNMKLHLEINDYFNEDIAEENDLILNVIFVLHTADELYKHEQKENKADDQYQRHYVKAKDEIMQATQYLMTPRDQRIPGSKPVFT